jgi:hypothetical protein
MVMIVVEKVENPMERGARGGDSPQNTERSRSSIAWECSMKGWYEHPRLNRRRYR